MPPKILVTTTTWFATPSRVALALGKAGARVSALLPRGNPLEKVRLLENEFCYSPISPLRSLEQAIRIVQPDLIIPCDDRAVEHLHQLHHECVLRSGDESTSLLIEKSLGSPSEYDVTKSRGKLLQLAAQCGIRVPRTAVVYVLEELKVWLTEYGYPAILKVDGSWGGTGVRVVRSWDEAERAFDQLTRPLHLLEALRLLSVHDLFPLFSQGSVSTRNVIVQTYIDGSSANAMFACWKGEVLADLTVQTLFSIDPLGSSTVVSTLRNSEIVAAGTILVKRLGISGFCGLDFIIEGKTGNVFLTELNPRITQLGHLEPNGEPSLANTLTQQLKGDILPRGCQPFTAENIAFFPHVLRCRRDDPILTLPNLRYDVPWEEPELTKELTRKPWSGRHMSAIVYGGIQKISEYVFRHYFKRSKTSDQKDRRPATNKAG